ncbi:MAG: serine hydrolase domain-containing protein [Flavobacteriaceae bacterium]
MIKKLLLLFVVCISNVITAQDAQTKKLDALFDQITNLDRAMGSVSVFKDGTEIYQRSFGYADVENTILATENTKYKIGSISKVYTATLILKLVEEGKLKLSTKLNAFFPEIPNAHQITIKNLLNHSSGLFNYTKSKVFYDWAIVEHTQEEFLQKIIENGVIFQPNDRHEYSNTNFVLLAFIAEKIYAKPFNSILQDELLTPLDLNQTQVGGEIDIDNEESYSYRKTDEWEKFPTWVMTNAIGAGSLIATPTDVNKFINALFTYKLLGKKWVDKMQKLTKYYGLGMFRYTMLNKEFYGHSGRMEKFQSLTLYNSNDKLTLTLCVNANTLDFNTLVKAVVAVLQNTSITVPGLQTIKLTHAKAIEGVYSGEGYAHKIKVFKDDNAIVVQRSGQKAYKTEAISETLFTIKQFNAEFKFSLEDQKLEFIQHGKGYILYKEKTDTP